MGKRKYDFAVFIGRMQPPHNGHINKIRESLQSADKLIIVLGSHRAARNIKNPWTTKEREEMVRQCFSDEDNERLIFTAARDHYYCDNIWVTEVQEQVRQALGNAIDPEIGRYPKIGLVGSYKDNSSYYLDLFPQWGREYTSFTEGLHATDVRNIYFKKPLDITAPDTSGISDMIPPEVTAYIYQWMMNNRNLYFKLADEWRDIQDYKELWSVAPYPVTFSTTDVVVVKAGHILMVRRKANYGKGLLALPGGFVKPQLSLIDSALEELKEETRIKIPKDELIKHLKDQRVFDYPKRSLRGRTITHAYYFELPSGGELPFVKGDDDAEKALWLPIAEAFSREHEMFEDHSHIISWACSRGE